MKNEDLTLMPFFGANRSSKKKQILKAFEEMVFPNVNILPFERQSGQVFGILKAELEKRGIGCSEPGLRISTESPPQADLRPLGFVLNEQL